jgi:hypothetical protein
MKDKKIIKNKEKLMTPGGSSDKNTMGRLISSHTFPPGEMGKREGAPSLS